MNKTIKAFLAAMKQSRRAAAEYEQTMATLDALLEGSKKLAEVRAHLKAGRLSVLDVKLGIFSPEDRIKQHQEATRYRLLDLEHKGEPFEIGKPCGCIVHATVDYLEHCRKRDCCTPVHSLEALAAVGRLAR